MANRTFIGRGWRYPFRFDPRTGGVAKDQGSGITQQLGRVRSALLLIVSVKKGELYFGRRLGSRFRNLIFTMNTGNLSQRIQFEVFAAFEDPEFGEKRAVIDRVRVFGPSRIDNRPQAEVEVYFILRGVNVEGNLVFPFYLSGDEREAAERGTSE